MITLKGLIYGKKIKVECEDIHVCAAFQSKVHDLLDVYSKEGCPLDCEYVIRKSEDNPVFICDVITTEEGEENGYRTRRKIV